MKFKGTKGEWRICETDTLKGNDGVNHVVLFSDDRALRNDKNYRYEVICIISPTEELNKEDEANAQLMASSKDLLEALQMMLSRFKGCDVGMVKADYVKGVAEKAINKALNLNYETTTNRG